MAPNVNPELHGSTRGRPVEKMMPADLGLILLSSGLPFLARRVDGEVSRGGIDEGLSGGLMGEELMGLGED